MPIMNYQMLDMKYENYPIDVMRVYFISSFLLMLSAKKLLKIKGCDI